jgi:hypothetical protein
MKSESIPVDILFPSLDWEEVKIHVAQRAGDIRPIDVFTRSFSEWQNDWNGAFHSNHCWNRKYIFSIIELPAQPGSWLFGGVFEVLSFRPGRSKGGKEGMIYKVDLADYGNSLIGRLVITWYKDARAKGRKSENLIDELKVAEILPERYAGEDFPGYAYIDHSYAVLEKLWKDSKPDWVSALSHCQGIYLITDVKTGMRYVGSAYGDEGIWARWNCYFNTGGHGNNKLLKQLLMSKVNSVEYARRNFKFCVLEQASSRDSEQYIIQRESYWKDVLMTRTKFGLNEN